MLYLLISIVSSIALVLIFKLYDKWNVNVLQAIIINYFTAALLGFVVGGIPIPFAEIPEKPWFYTIFIFGLGFVTTFTLLGISTQKVGITVATVAFKMSMVIPVIGAVFLYDESMNLIKIAGIVLACISIVMVALKEGQGDIERKYLFMPLIVFVGCGLLDTFFKYSERYYIQEKEASLFCALTLLVSALGGLLFFLLRSIKVKSKFEAKSIWAGIVLGIPNYISLYFLFKALRGFGDESSVIFPLNNMGIVAGSTLAAYFIFREKLSLLNWAGIGLALVSIAMIAWA